MSIAQWSKVITQGKLLQITWRIDVYKRSITKV